MAQEKRMMKERDELLDHPGMRRALGFIQGEVWSVNPLVFFSYHLVGCMNNWHLDVTKECLDVIQKCRSYNPSVQLRPPSDSLPFSGMTINMGSPKNPGVVTGIHLDCMNYPFCPCVVYSSGSFDHTKGGHFALHDSKRLVKFPPGCAIYVSSAVTRHSNVPVQEGEARQSFTMYMAGALVRFAQGGCQLLHGRTLHNSNVGWSPLERVGGEWVVQR